ncbi:MAG: PAC2 family protein [Candidatus Diapherotrites archaeon]
MAVKIEKKEIGDIKFVEFKKVDLKGFTLIEGFPGMGLVGTICAKYIVDKMEFEQLGYIDSGMFVPIIRIHEGLPVFPSRIYFSKKMKLVVLVSEQVIPQNHTAKLAKAVVKWIEEKKITKIISLSGIKATPEGEHTTEIYGIASNQKTKKLLKANDIEIIREGITTGVTALILLELMNKKIDAYSLMGNVESAADYTAAAAVMKKLSSILKFKIDVEPLMKEAQDVEQSLIKHMKDIKNTGDQVKELELSSGHTPMFT